MAVYVANLIINTDSDYVQTFTLEDATSNSELDLTGYTVAATMRKWPGAKDNAVGTVDFSTTITNTTGGQLEISLTDTQTAALKDGRHCYDIVITDASGVKTRVVEGSVIVSQGVTR